jgi:hypothetical protein
MLSLNLISPDQKKENKLTRIFYFITSIDFVLIFFIVLIGMIMVVSKYVIENYYQNELAINNITKKIVENTANEKNFTAQFENISNIQSEFIPWSVVMNDLSSIIKDDITITALHLDRVKKKFVISGRAGKRDSLLDLKQNLDSIEYLANIDFPLKNILQKENIDFEINADLVLEKIIKIPPSEK